MTYLNNNFSPVTKVRKLILEKQVDGIIFYSPINRRWFTDFNSTAGFLVVGKTKSILYLDGRYITKGKQSAKNVDEVKQIATNSFKDFLSELNQDLRNQNITKLGFDKTIFTYQQYEDFKDFIPQLVPLNLSNIREIKSNSEIINLKKACELSENALLKTLKKIQIGMTEKDINNILISEFYQMGAEKLGFDTIVASGIRGALPHGMASDKIINHNELITIDFGAYFNGFCADITRTYCIGTVSNKLKEIFKVVAIAQKKAIQAIKPGVKSKTIDKIARDYIELKGYGKYFVHSTGHGLGREVHEFPRVSPFADVILQPGMVITVEPGIYIPNLGGVRIEDDILVTEKGYLSLTTIPKYNDNYEIIDLKK